MNTVPFPPDDAVLETIGEALLLVDGSFNVHRMNTAAEALYGVKRDSVIGQPLRALIGGVNPSDVAAGLETVRRGEVWHSQVWHFRPGGAPFRAEVKVRALTPYQGFVALIEDVTAREAATAQQQILNQALRAIAETESSTEMYQRVLECLVEQGGVDTAIFRVRDGAQYRLVASVGAEHPSFHQPMRFTDVEPALLRGEVITATLGSGEVHSRFGKAQALGFSEVQVVGQRLRGQLIGTLGLMYRRAHLDLTPVLPQLASALATQLERAAQLQHLSHRNRLLELLNRIDRLALEHTPIQTLLGHLFSGLRELFSVHEIAVGHVPSSESSLTWLRRSGGETELGAEVLPLEGLVAEAVRSRRLVHSVIGARSGLYVPMADSEGTLILALERDEGPFLEEETRDAQFIAAQLALALARSQGHERLLRERRGLEVLAQVSGAMRQAQSLTELYQIAADYTLRATGASTTIVLLANEARDHLHFAAISGVNAEQMRCLPVTRERGLSWRVLDTGAPRIEDIAAHLPEAHTVRPLAQGAYIGVPIFAGDGATRHTIGVLTADTQADGERFQPTDLDCMTAVAEALGSARARIEALETAQRRAEAFALLAQLSSDLESLDDELQIAERGLDVLLTLTGLEAAAYFSYQDGLLKPLAVIGELPPHYLKSRQASPVEPMQGAFGEALELGEARIYEDYQTYPGALESAKAFGFRTAMLTPIKLNGQVRAFLGTASFSRVVTLPPNIREVAEFLGRRLSRAVERAEQISEILSTRAASFRTLGRALEIRDFETKGHTDRVVDLSLRLGRRVGLSEMQLQHLEWGAFLHDIGKIAVPDGILLKPGKLTPEEWTVIRDHPEIGYRMLEDLHFLPSETLEIVRYHQERLNGSGYPEARRGAEIPYLARLFAVVDVFDALTSVRPYKTAWSLEAASAELRAQAGVTLDAALVEAFLELPLEETGDEAHGG